MNRDAKFRAPFGGAEQTFRLAIGELRELQECCKAGPFEIFRRMLTGTWLVDDIRETIRIGLIGGGMDAKSALGLTVRYVDELTGEWEANRSIACQVLECALLGPEDEKVGKKHKAANKTN